MMMAANQARPCQSLPLASICAAAALWLAASAVAPAVAASVATSVATARVIVSPGGRPQARGIVCGRRPDTFLLLRGHIAGLWDLLLRGQIAGIWDRFSRLPPILSSQCSSTPCILHLKVFLPFGVGLKLMFGKVFLGFELLFGSILYRLDESLLNLGESLYHLVRYAHDIISARLESGHGTAHRVFKGCH